MPNEKEMLCIISLFNLEDYVKDLLFNASTEEQEQNARNIMKKIKEEFKKLYIPTPIENV